MMMIMMMNSRIGSLTWSASCFVVSSSYTLLNQTGQRSSTTSTKSSKWCSHTWWHGSTSGPSRTPWQPPTGWKLATTGFWRSDEVWKGGFQLFRVARTMGLRGEALFARWPSPVFCWKPKAETFEVSNSRGEYEHALVFFYRVKHLTGGRDRCQKSKKSHLPSYPCNYLTMVKIRRGNEGVQRCLDTIKTLVEKVFLKNVLLQKSHNKQVQDCN